MYHSIHRDRAADGQIFPYSNDKLGEAITNVADVSSKSLDDTLSDVITYACHVTYELSEGGPASFRLADILD